MRVVVIGGTGHIGSQLIPMLADAGIEVIAISRGRIGAVQDGGSKLCRLIQCNYQADDRDWARVLVENVGEGDAVVDLLGIDLMGTYKAVRERCEHVIACGSVWMVGMPRRVPCPAEAQIEFWGDSYRQRWRVIQEIVSLSAAGGPRFTAILPPNICGPGKIPLETRGGRSIEVHRELARGATVRLPEGADALIGPCDAYDVAKAFFLSISKPERASGRVFNVGSAYALTAGEFVATYARIYGVTIPIDRVSWAEFSETDVPDAMSRYHFEAHMCPDISPISGALGYEPRFTPEQTMERAVNWMRSRRML